MRCDCDRPSSPRFWQRVVRHGADWEPTTELLARLAQGTVIFVTGALIAQTRYLAARMPQLEFVVAWATCGSRPWLMANLFLPREQSLTGSHCVATGRALLAIGRQAEAMDGAVSVCMMLHSHASFAASFLSYIDVQTVKALADEGIARQASQWQSYNPAAVPASGEGSSLDARRWILRSPDQPAVSLSLATDRRDVTSEDFRVELQTEMRRTVSCFGVINALGDVYLPTFRRTTCGVCGNPVSEALEGSDIEIHILGPEEMSDETRQLLDDQLASLTILSSACPTGSFSRRSDEKWQSHGYRLADASDQQGDRTASPSNDYGVWRHGKFVGRIPPALMERVAAQIPEVAVCLGWDDAYTAAIRATAAQDADAPPRNETSSED